MKVIQTTVIVWFWRIQAKNKDTSEKQRYSIIDFDKEPEESFEEIKDLPNKTLEEDFRKWKIMNRGNYHGNI